MRATQKKLLEFLKECERTGRTFTVEQAAEASGLSAASMRTYLSKKLRGRWVRATDEQHYDVLGMNSVSDDQFRQVMTQKSSATPGSQAEWEVQVRELLAVGKEQGFAVRRSVNAILNNLGVI
jgi:hypothetical protein